MPIDFACACGERLQVDNQFGGRQVKCPSCARLVTAPLSPGGAAATPGPPAAHPPLPGERHSANGGAELFRKVSLTALWAGILGCTAPVLGWVIPFAVRLEVLGLPAIILALLLMLGVGPAGSIIGIVTGAVGLKRANTRYKRHAVAGLVTGIIGAGIAVYILAFAAFFFSVFRGPG